MMIDVDGLSRRFGFVLAQHLCIAALLHKIDITNQPNAYNSSIGPKQNVPRLDPTSVHNDIHVPISCLRILKCALLPPRFWLDMTPANQHF